MVMYQQPGGLVMDMLLMFVGVLAELNAGKLDALLAVECRHNVAARKYAERSSSRGASCRGVGDTATTSPGRRQASGVSVLGRTSTSSLSGRGRRGVMMTAPTPRRGPGVGVRSSRR